MDKRIALGPTRYAQPLRRRLTTRRKRKETDHLIRPNSVVLTAGSTLKAAQSSPQRADVRTLDRVYRSLFHPHLGPPGRGACFAIFDCFRLIVRAGRQVHQMLG